MQLEIFAGELLTVPIALTNDDGTPYEVTGATVLRIAQLGDTVACVEESVDITTDPDTPRVEFNDTAGLLGIYSVQLIDTSQPLVLADGMLVVRPMLAPVPAP